MLKSVNRVLIGMDLKKLVRRLEEFADTRLAASWDNVGLLVEPSEALLVKRALVTNDLTESVLKEALDKHVNLIISYHPPIFASLKRLTQSEWKQKSIVSLIENRIALYSPHTAWDSIQGGINDWILQPFQLKKSEPIDANRALSTPNGFSKTVRVALSFGTSKDKLLARLSSLDSIRLVFEQEISGVNGVKQVEVEFVASDKGVAQLIDMLKEFYPESNDIFASIRIHDQQKAVLTNVGIGRVGYLTEPMVIGKVVEAVKKHFGMATFRIALGNNKTLDDKVKTIASFAGSAGNHLNNINNVDLIITGEMPHHDILHLTHRGVCVIVTDHTNCERGFRSVFVRELSALLARNNEPHVEFLVSETDRDPLQYI